MNISLFEYPYPKELVAQHPLPERDASRLLVLHRAEGRWEHRQFPDLVEYLRLDDLIVANNAEADLVPFEGKQVPPLPPYIKRKSSTDFTEEDFQRYRTIYAKVPGSKAAPTAGFHFSEKILKKVEGLGTHLTFVTLHVGYDTFKPIRTPSIKDHSMHGEEFSVPEETAHAVEAAKKEGRRVIAIGTTTVRALESWAAGIREKTSLYITPGFQFQIVDGLVTNFHRPRSTVLVMVSSFAGRELVLSAYREAIEKKYRLFSYGDAMLIL